MKRLWKVAAISLLGMATLAPATVASPPSQRHPSRVIVRGGFYRPVYPHRFYRSYDPFWDPFWDAGFYSTPAPPPTTGELKIKDPAKNATLYIDGGLVGPADKFKKTQLAPGTHRVELRNADGDTIYRQTVTVVLGKTVELKPSADPENS